MIVYSLSQCPQVPHSVMYIAQAKSIRGLENTNNDAGFSQHQVMEYAPDAHFIFLLRNGNKIIKTFIITAMHAFICVKLSTIYLYVNYLLGPYEIKLSISDIRALGHILERAIASLDARVAATTG